MIKRLLDILLSLTALAALSPLLIAVSAIIVIESPGAPIYKSVRIGKNWKKFTFYKFRSMKKWSDKELDALKSRNAYLCVKEELETDLYPAELKDVMLYSDNYKVNEFDYLTEVSKDKNCSFIKVDKDPRITHFGRFIRKTSIDELPQLFNILLGQMSFVGNRPLSIAESELLTTDKYAERFACAAGLTGLWQIQKNKDSMSPDLRRDLDVEYARNESVAYDTKLFFLTIKKLFERDNV